VRFLPCDHVKDCEVQSEELKYGVPRIYQSWVKETEKSLTELKAVFLTSLFNWRRNSSRFSLSVILHLMRDPMFSLQVLPR
jgi:hypothetical protein